MAAQHGRIFLLKIGDGATSEVFTTIAALRATQLAINGDIVDVGTKDDFISGVLWRSLLAGGGVRSLTLSGGGIFTNDQTQQDLADLSLTGALTNFQLNDGNRTWEGAFQCSNYTQDGPHDNAQTFAITLESSGQVTIT